MIDLLEATRIAFRQQAQLPDAEVAEPLADTICAHLLPLVRQHRLLGLWSAALVPAWRTAMHGQLVHMARCADEALRVMDVLTALDQEAFLLKGPVLAVQAWEQPALRQYDDLDVRCRRLPYPALAQAMATCGYAPEHADARRMAALWHFGWGIGFVKAPGLIVECNWRWFPPHYPRLERCLPAEAAATLVTLDGMPVRGARPVAHLLHSSMHLVWHNWSRLAWLVDIAGLLVREPAVLGAARAFAGKQGFVRQALELCCALADAVLGPLPGHFQDVSVMRMTGIRQALLGGTQADGRVAERTEHVRNMLWHEQWAYRLRHAATPGDPDFVRWTLPPGANGVYWGLRPLRILGKKLKTENLKS